MNKNKLPLIILAGSIVRLCFHFPAIIVWLLGSAIIFLAIVRPMIILAKAVKKNMEDE